ncbi:aminotransferase DegT [Helicobacter sp. 12S02634-8]|uniref:DegT/DnrJ/EryC1/StrS family aminotransferase n=1 Tax=Helicobacter sp. 12S02634-8 TaxID=1476199 RepID=UPI000BA7A4A5|nr:DegT/DnrJ/EryC1/StrS family aminotransferase [Helicobacter sp. 12S02634-8]PAF47065.1 aminotransferase DegT [Helicobacter sp. 12S02634-8]
MPIQVNKPYLPDIKKYQKYLETIWNNHHLTNFGPLSCALEERLCDYLGIDHALFVANGTIALQIAYKLAGLQRDDAIITTPFSFVATTSTLLWEGLKPVFCDISPTSFCIDTHKIPTLITEKTKAILGVHVFGNPCEVQALQALADKHNLKVIYDAAHAFGVRLIEKTSNAQTAQKGTSIFNYGDISTLSLHATKLFHSIEGGLIIAKDPAYITEAKKLINFGLANALPTTIGINAKNSEFHAAMGLCVLDDIDTILQERQRIWEYYYKHLKDDFTTQTLHQNASNNYHYFPIVFPSQEELSKALTQLNALKIFPRRYFYPSLDDLSFAPTPYACPISRDIASKILCLPLYVGLPQVAQDSIIHTLKTLKHAEA